MKKYTFIIVVLVICFVILASCRISYRKGYADSVLKIIPGELFTQIQVYSVSTNISDKVLPSILTEDSVKLKIYALLDLLKDNKERVLRLQSRNHRDGFRFDRESFERNIKIAQQIVEDIELVTLREALEPLMGNDEKGVKDDRHKPSRKEFTDGDGD